MAGNAREWVQDLFPPEGTLRVVRGGSYGETDDDLQTTARFGYHPAVQDATVSFRCVSDRQLPGVERGCPSPYVAPGSMGHRPKESMVHSQTRRVAPLDTEPDPTMDDAVCRGVEVRRKAKGYLPVRRQKTLQQAPETTSITKGE